MGVPPGHDSPYPAAPPPPPNDQPNWFSVVWQAVSRVALFGIGAVLVFKTGTTDVQVTAGAGLMLASAGLALAKGLK